MKSPLALSIEALVFASENPISPKEIRECLEEVFETKMSEKDVLAELEQLIRFYEEGDFSFQIQCINGGYQFLTKASHHRSLSALLKNKSKKKLSQSTLETLAVVAYKQPITKSELEKIRGVNCDYSVQKLLEKELIASKGRAETPGKPLLYGTSDKFMDYMGLKTLADLPKLKDFAITENEIGL